MGSLLLMPHHVLPPAVRMHHHPPNCRAAAPLGESSGPSTTFVRKGTFSCLIVVWSSLQADAVKQGWHLKQRTIKMTLLRFYLICKVNSFYWIISLAHFNIGSLEKSFLFIYSRFLLWHLWLPQMRHAILFSSLQLDLEHSLLWSLSFNIYSSRYF